MSIKTIYDALRAVGMTKEGACALMGNMRAESAMRSNNVQDSSARDDLAYTELVDNGDMSFMSDSIGYGLCQWTLAIRKRKLYAFMKAMGVSIGDEAMQVQFCIKELKEDFPGVWEALTSSNDLFQCTQLVCKEYERPATSNVGTRYEYALSFFNELANGQAASFPSAEPKYKPDLSVLILQAIMVGNGYDTEMDGFKSEAFFVKLREFTADMEGC